MKKKLVYRVVAAYDTETTNDYEHSEAFVTLYIVNDIRGVKPLDSYVVDDPREHIMFGRTLNDMRTILNSFIEDGQRNHYVPIVAAYNLGFDIQTLIADLAADYDLTTTAQSATNMYVMDVNDKETGTPVLRFWDTYFLEQNGLKAMGETAGVPKAVGDWDYDLTRTPDTPLSARELHYASRDVQVIPAYLAYLLKANEWLTPDMLGSSVISRTGLVRQMAIKEIAPLKMPGYKLNIGQQFYMLCADEFPKDYDTYALRKACFRGGLTFTAARYASTVEHDVASLDVTSMHHTFINGRRVPIKFRRTSKQALERAVTHVCNTSMHYVLNSYYKPFLASFHAIIRFTNIRLREGSPFAYHGIGIIPRGKFGREVRQTEFFDHGREMSAENEIRARGYKDKAVKPVFAYGKLMSAETCELHVSELEMWCIRQAYEWDGLEVIDGEATTATINPPAYVTLQSNLLFNRKTELKNITKHYKQGTPYDRPIPASVPEGLANELRAGTMDERFLMHYYTGTVKGQFNSIYGTQAQDLMKPDYAIDNTGHIAVDQLTVATPDNYTDKIPQHNKVLYTYGLRIVGGSRMHLCIAIMLLWERFGERVHVTGGDTDSLKVACNGVTDAELEETLQPLLDASTQAISTCETDIRNAFPNITSDLNHVGGFEVENAGDHYTDHMELWNKARLSRDKTGHCHITMAGLSRPVGRYHIENWLDDMLTAGHSFKYVAERVGWDTTVTPELCYSLEHTRPDPTDRYNRQVTDYTGKTITVNAPMAICLYPASRRLGDTTKPVNYECIQYVKRVYGRTPYNEPHTVGVTDDTVYLSEWDNEVSEAKHAIL